MSPETTLAVCTVLTGVGFLYFTGAMSQIKGLAEAWRLIFFALLLTLFLVHWHVR